MKTRRAKIGLRGTPEQHALSASQLAGEALKTVDDGETALMRQSCGEAVSHLTDAARLAGAFAAHAEFSTGHVDTMKVLAPVSRLRRAVQAKCIVRGQVNYAGLGSPEGAYDLITLLKTVDPSDLSFAAARYDSAKAFKKAVEAAHENDSAMANVMMFEALEATTGDGGNYGTVPTLSPKLQAIFDRATNLSV